MTVKELKNLLSSYSDDKEILVKCRDGYAYGLHASLCLANEDQGEILAEEFEEEFDLENNPILLLEID